MNKIKLLLALICSVVVLASCSTTILPTATSTVNSVRLDELNLTREDYQVLKTVTADATVHYKEFMGMVTISDVNDEFSVKYKQRKGLLRKKQAGPKLMGYSGFFKMGFLSNDIGEIRYDNPFEFARRLAIYRIINLAQIEGADGVIEPIISTNMSKDGLTTKITTTVSAKLVTLKTD